jgi:hypothetical protein
MEINEPKHELYGAPEQIGWRDRFKKLAANATAAECALGLVVAVAATDFLEDQITEVRQAKIVAAEAPVHKADVLPKTIPKPRVTDKSKLPATHAPKKQAVRPTDTQPIKWREVRLPDNPNAKPGDSLLRLTKLVTRNFVSDISHPQCEGKKSNNTAYRIGMDALPRVASGLDNAPLAVIGVNGGRPFTANRCLQDLASVPQNYDFYINSANPGLNVMRKYVQAPYHCKSTDRLCIAEAYGALSANHALQLVQKANLSAPHGYWWIDVETMNAWKGSGYENRAILTGMIKVLKAANSNPQIGFYSAPTSIIHPDRPSQWTKITNIGEKDEDGNLVGWLNGYDSWIATGSGTEGEAKRACVQRESFTGGRLVMSQYSEKVNGVTVDANVLC